MKKKHLIFLNEELNNFQFTHYRINKIIGKGIYRYRYLLFWFRGGFALTKSRTCDDCAIKATVTKRMDYTDTFTRYRAVVQLSNFVVLFYFTFI